MPFSNVRNDMRKRQKSTCNVQSLEDMDVQQSDIISRNNKHKISLLKLSHMNKVASTASPLLPKTPNRVRALQFDGIAVMSCLIFSY